MSTKYFVILSTIGIWALPIVLKAGVSEDAVAIFDQASGSSGSYQALLSWIAMVLVYLFGGWVLVASFRSWSENEMSFFSLFFMTMRVGVVVVLLNSVLSLF